MRKTKRSWMRKSKYRIYLNPNESHLHLNVAQAFERMAKSAKWKKAFELGIDAYCREYKSNPNVRAGTPKQLADRIWGNTMVRRGKKTNCYGPSLWVTPGTDSGSFNPVRGVRVGPPYGSGVYAVSRTLQVTLHELVHYMHLSKVRPRVVNGRRRPHDRMFNAMLCQMAKSFWGYDHTPATSGYSVGRGYAPSNHLEKWLQQQLVKELENQTKPKILKWLSLDAAHPQA